MKTPFQEMLLRGKLQDYAPGQQPLAKTNGISQGFGSYISVSLNAEMTLRIETRKSVFFGFLAIWQAYS